MEKKKHRKYTVSDFSQNKDGAIQKFLHHAFNHMQASVALRKHPTLLDSSAYMCNLAFELLFKSMLLSQSNEYMATHSIVALNNKLSKKIIAKNDLSLIKVIDKYNLIRYPIDNNLHKSQPMLKLGHHKFYVDEIGTIELEKAENLFEKLWCKLQRLKEYKPLINDILKNPHKKGNRVLMNKRRDRS
ncbi:MAG TPA: HEPN domain-containing protein [Gammaproteobacteria bacterium]|jgi:HEPN domain-containing protein|nr:HEPN domain-containing protein [Gammaproteobacteria bacterium]